MAFGALESLGDPLIDPILALLKDAVNAEILALTTAMPAEDARAAIQTTSRRPFVLGVEGEGALPALHCYRVRSRTSQFTAVHLDYINTLQFTYATPACSQDLLDERWAILDRVWRIALKALKRGKHPAHNSGADVLEAAGVVKVDYATGRKQEAFIEHGGSTFPGFVAEIDVTWRNPADEDTSALYPALSFDSQFFVDTDGDTSGTPDVIARALTEAGEADPDGKDFPRPSDWSL
jgi:hypothetical protein